MTMLKQLKETYGDDVKTCLQAGIDSDIASPTTRARLEWAIEEIDALMALAADLNNRIEVARMDGFEAGWQDAEAWFTGGNDDW
jgi:hypothetical protein